ncbi:hypothetical protein QYF36_021183 [Acer negundo]|nr:hypothetical protein QYF36_021183 [Acer negundo]
MSNDLYDVLAVISRKRKAKHLIRHPKDFIETAKVKEEDTELEPAKEMKRKSSSRRKSSSHQSKAKARKSGGNSADGAKLDKPNIVDEP